MSDPLLTSLCTICHIQSPKYKCPRCDARTCSLSCVKKHKSWSSCNGERDPTAFVQLGKLKTDAGIDHDYNFLTKIERSVERAERILREDRDILPEENSNPPPQKKTRFNQGHSRGRTTVDGSPRTLDKNAMHRMRKLGIHVSFLPYGMMRAKENKTSWNRRTHTINWQIEWILFNTEPSKATAIQPHPSRMIYKALDETPLHVALDEALEFHRQHQLSDHERAEEKKANRRQQALRKGTQDSVTSTWYHWSCAMQDHRDGSWSGSEINSHRESHSTHRFFFLRPRTQPGMPKRLVPIDSKKNLATLLPGQEIIEFPTICVLPMDAAGLPDGFITEETRTEVSSRKRKASGILGYEDSPNGCSSGEDDADMVEEDSEDTSSSGSDSDSD
ncbi:hypothetical protein F5Y17DRAFT_229237 [Xylariaceae sp. FL0594]|nr:hypothetical protein F5Y17DRAFT_229237 [Xylariaceae sp. FL0594]